MVWRARDHYNMGLHSMWKNGESTFFMFCTSSIILEPRSRSNPATLIPTNQYNKQFLLLVLLGQHTLCTHQCYVYSGTSTAYCSTSTIIETRKQTIDIPVDWNNSTLNQDKIQLTMQSKSLLQNTVETRSQCKNYRTTWVSPWPGQMMKFAVLELLKLGPIFQYRRLFVSWVTG